MNSEMETVLKTIINIGKGSECRTNINTLKKAELNWDKERIMNCIRALSQLGYVDEQANGLIITVTPIGKEYLVTKHERMIGRYWMEFRTHIIYPIFTGIAGTLLGSIATYSFMKFMK